MELSSLYFHIYNFMESNISSEDNFWTDLFVSYMGP